MSWVDIDADVYNVDDTNIPGKALYITDLLAFVRLYGGNYQLVPVHRFEECREVLERDPDWRTTLTVFESTHGLFMPRTPETIRVGTTFVIDGDMREVTEIDRDPDDADESEVVAGLGLVGSDAVLRRVPMDELKQWAENGDAKRVKRLR